MLHSHRLVQALAIRQCLLELSPATITHVVGTDNTLLANTASQAIPQIDNNHEFYAL